MNGSRLLIVALASALAAALSCSSPQPERPPRVDPPAAKPESVAPEVSSEKPASEPTEQLAPLSSASFARIRVMDVSGGVHTIGTSSVRASVLVFLAADDPAKADVPALSQLAGGSSGGGAELLGVLSEPTLTRTDAADFVKRAAIDFPVVFDASGELATRLEPERLPEAFVVGHDGTLRYRGSLGGDLEKAVRSVVAGEPVAKPRTHPAGRPFEAWKTAALPAKVTWARDIAPLVHMHCASCHRSGQVGPFPLLSRGDVAKRAKMIAEVTESRYMPPWHAEPGFGSFRDEHRLSDRELALLAAFRDQGAPEGDARDLPPEPVFTSGWALGEPDLVLSMPRPFQVHASGDDIYRAFVLPTGLTEDKFVSAVEVRPGNPSVLHHCFVLLDETGTARKREKDGGEYGFPGFGNMGFESSGALDGWLPGVTPRFSPDGIARFLPKKADIVLIAHYHPTGKEEEDRTSIGIYFAKKTPTKLIHNFTLTNQNIAIPAGDPHYKRTIRVTLPRDMEVVAIMPHMHLVGREMKVTATTPRGEVRPAIWIRYWNFRWQDLYVYDEPQVYPRGTWIELEASYDNSSVNPMNPSYPPKNVFVGWGTTDEMCECLLHILLPYRPGSSPSADAKPLLDELYRSVVAPK